MLSILFPTKAAAAAAIVDNCCGWTNKSALIVSVQSSPTE
jgi:hypothetical protein